MNQSNKKQSAWDLNWQDVLALFFIGYVFLYSETVPPFNGSGVGLFGIGLLGCSLVLFIFKLVDLVPTLKAEFSKPRRWYVDLLTGIGIVWFSVHFLNQPGGSFEAILMVAIFMLGCELSLTGIGSLLGGIAKSEEDQKEVNKK